MRAQPPISRTVVHFGVVGNQENISVSSVVLGSNSRVNENEQISEEDNFIFEDEI